MWRRNGQVFLGVLDSLDYVIAQGRTIANINVAKQIRRAAVALSLSAKILPRQCLEPRHRLFLLFPVELQLLLAFFRSRLEILPDKSQLRDAP